MPRPKRGLSEADANARVKTAKTNKAGEVETKTASTKVTIKVTGIQNKTAAGKKATAETKSTARKIGTTTEKTAEKASTGKKASVDKTGTGTGKKTAALKISSTEEKSSAEKTGAGQSRKARKPTAEWITYCRPSWDRCSDEDSNDDEEEYEDENPSPHGPDCKCKIPLSENPDWPWVASKDGFALALKWQTEQMKRCQDEFGVYFYNDYNGYGIGEVVDNILVALNNELIRKRIMPMKLWAQLEGMSIFLNTDIGEWFGCDDPDGIDARIHLIGNGILTALSILESRSLLNPDTTTIKNIPLTLGLFLMFTNDWCGIAGDEEGSTAWKSKVVALAKKWGIVIKGSRGMEKIVKEIDEGGEGEEQDDSEEESWEEEFSAFKADHGTAIGPHRATKFGGTYYDITKLPKRQLEAMREGY